MHSFVDNPKQNLTCTFACGMPKRVCDSAHTDSEREKGKECA